MYGNRQTYHTKADLISGGFGKGKRLARRARKEG